MLINDNEQQYPIPLTYKELVYMIQLIIVWNDEDTPIGLLEKLNEKFEKINANKN